MGLLYNRNGGSMKKILLATLGIAVLWMAGCAAQGTVVHKVTTIQHSFLQVVGAFQDAESAEYAQGFVPQNLHIQMETAIGKVALAGKDLDAALAANATAPDIKSRLDNIYTLLDSIQTDGLTGIKNPSTKATLEIALDGIKAIIDNALTQVQ